MTTSPRLVLVVEDDPMLRDMVRRQLGKLGFEAVLVGSGEEALEQSHAEVGLILMDIGLPGMDGAYAAMLIREKELRDQKKRTPIVALTGHSDRQRVLSVGIDDFLQKPALIADIKLMCDRWIPEND
jgi:CheY-like chemotaxis protein